MGHTSDIHKSCYRLPNDVYQMAKVSKLLILNERGEASNYKGKTLDEIEIDLNVVEENSDEDGEEIDDRNQQESLVVMENKEYYIMDLEYYKCKAELSSAIDDILNEVVVKEEPIEIKTFSEYGVLNEYLEKNDSKSSPTHFYKNEDFNGLVGELAKPKVNHCENDDEDLPMNIDLLTDNAGLIKQTFKTEFDIDIIYEDVKPQICEEKSSGENENEFYLNSVTDKSIGTNISLELSKDYETWSQQNIEEDGKAVMLRENVEDPTESKVSPAHFGENGNFNGLAVETVKMDCIQTILKSFQKKHGHNKI
ncbi:hypothetical protein JTB14_018686 [Gonioctena quinquepunctata]|nr:hypothetical protein JTB14_018686 [Gonioctena quinquepunctata]